MPTQGRGGHEQTADLSNGERFKPAVAERDKKQTMIDLRGISTNWFKNQLCPSKRLSRLWAQAPADFPSLYLFWQKYVCQLYEKTFSST